MALQIRYKIDHITLCAARYAAHVCTDTPASMQIIRHS